MSNENYIVINGKKSELTEEQLKQIGIAVRSNYYERNNPFAESCNGDYYYIENDDVVRINCSYGKTRVLDTWVLDALHHSNVNYFNDKDFANQVMLHQQLYRKLLKYAYDNNTEVTEKDWEDDITEKYYICYSYCNKRFISGLTWQTKNACTVYFKNEAIAKQAIKDVIEPFMKEYPEFIW